MNMANRPGSSILFGIFDLQSLLVWFGLLIILTASLLFRSDGSTLFTVLSMYQDQSVRLKTKSGFFALAIFTSTMFSIMYKSKLISHLTKPKEMKRLDRLEDLKDMDTDFKVWVWSPSYIEDYVRATFQPLVETGRFQFMKDPTDETILQGFFSGTLAILELFDFATDLFLNPVVNPSLDCKLHRDNLYQSKTSYIHGFMGPVSSKNYALKDKVKLALMRMDESGFNPNLHDFHWTKSVYQDDRIHNKTCERKNANNHVFKECIRNTEQVQKLSLAHFSNLFTVFGLGLSLSCVIFLMELTGYFDVWQTFYLQRNRNPDFGVGL